MFISFFYFSLFSKSFLFFYFPNEQVSHFKPEKQRINIDFNALEKLNKDTNVLTSTGIKLFYTATKIKQKIYVPINVCKGDSFH